ncbi:hypothetical protein FGO68_gene11589 [Halteria grandinella]|uniref:Transmembrane protein n=1 Tax=Halteria grandinella TaxID=5974 RepID=A0A8J8NRE9_HALGN|nr:hypothetical protein FGO68_gene11589 [Halteria grandinella]
MEAPNQIVVSESFLHSSLDSDLPNRTQHQQHKSLNRTCLYKFKRFLKRMSLGQIYNGIYFNKNQQTSSWLGVLVTVMGFAVLIYLVQDVIRNTLEFEMGSDIKIDQIEQSQKELNEFTQTIGDFFSQSKLAFQIKAFSFIAYQKENITCDRISMQITYYFALPGKAQPQEPSVMNFTCGFDSSGYLKYSIDPKNNAQISNITFSREQYINVTHRFNRTALTFNHSDTDIYFLYHGDSYSFTGSHVMEQDFTSLDFPLGNYYKTQITPFFYQNLSSLMPFTNGLNTYMYYQFLEPYFQKDISKFTNDNNPYQLITVNSFTLMDAFSKIGGYYSALFAIIGIFALQLNKYMFKKDLQKAFKGEVGTILLKKSAGVEMVEDDGKVVNRMIKRLLSYEMLMHMSVYFHKENQKVKREGSRNINSEMSQRLGGPQVGNQEDGEETEEFMTGAAEIQQQQLFRSASQGFDFNKID